jgi:hypothetical protein
MAWIESHQAVGHHPKTIRFAELLHVNLPTAVGHLHYFWWWALDFAPSGDIPTTPTVVARACEWRGQPQRFVDALVSAGFVELRGDSLTIHDWLDYAGRLVEKRAANRERQRRHRNAENDVTSRVTNALVTGLPTGPTNQPTGDSYLVSPTNQPTEPDQPNPPNPPFAPSEVGDAPPNGAPNGSSIEFVTKRSASQAACCPNFAATGSEHWQFCPNAPQELSA